MPTIAQMAAMGDLNTGINLLESAKTDYTWQRDGSIHSSGVERVRVEKDEPTYATIYEGEWTDEQRPYYVIHRIASAEGSKGVLKAILQYCFQHTDNIRIDTHRDNVIMRHLLGKLGFTYCGIIYLANGDERLAYQRIGGPQAESTQG